MIVFVILLIHFAPSFAEDGGWISTDISFISHDFDVFYYTYSAWGEVGGPSRLSTDYETSGNIVSVANVLTCELYPEQYCVSVRIYEYAGGSPLTEYAFDYPWVVAGDTTYHTMEIYENIDGDFEIQFISYDSKTNLGSTSWANIKSAF